MARKEFPGCGPVIIGAGAGAPDEGSGAGIVVGWELPDPSGACTAILVERHAAAPRRRVRGAYARTFTAPGDVRRTFVRKTPVRRALCTVSTARQRPFEKTCAFTVRRSLGLTFPLSETACPICSPL